MRGTTAIVPAHPAAFTFFTFALCVFFDASFISAASGQPRRTAATGGTPVIRKKTGTLQFGACRREGRRIVEQGLSGRFRGREDAAGRVAEGLLGGKGDVAGGGPVAAGR